MAGEEMVMELDAVKDRAHGMSQVSIRRRGGDTAEERVVKDTRDGFRVLTNAPTVGELAIHPTPQQAASGKRQQAAAVQGGEATEGGIARGATWEGRDYLPQSGDARRTPKEPAAPKGAMLHGMRAVRSY